MTERITPVAIVNRSGLRLPGLVHEPIGGVVRSQTVVLLSPGVKMRVAPHRLYNKLAADLTRQGFRVLRFDFSGLGDAEGVLEEPLLKGLYASIQLGRYVDDTTAALDWLQRQYRATEFIVGGLCGGAITAVLAASRDPRITGILGLGLPVTLDAPGTDSTRFMTVGQLKGIRARYLRKVLDPRSWLRVFRLRTDFRLLFKALTARSAPARPEAERVALHAAPAASDNNTNPLFAPAFFASLERGCSALLVFSEMDRLTAEYEEKFRQRHLERLSDCGSRVQTHTIAQANHVLTFAEWQEEWFRVVRDWCDRHSPAEPLAAGARRRECAGSAQRR